eukprot:214404-Prorocentrum_minimum.AAC.1
MPPRSSPPQAPLTRLATLHLADACVRDADLAAVARGAPALASLALLKCEEISDLGLAALAPLAHLRHLEMHAATAVRWIV